MAPVARRSCPYKEQGCDWRSPDDEFICTVDEALTYMKIHAPDCSFNPKNASPAQTSQVQDRRGAPRPQPLERPKIEAEMTENEWQRVKAKWERYKRSTLSPNNASEEHVTDQLWGSCSHDLENMLRDLGLDNSATESQMISTIRSIAVKAQNVLLNVQKFFEMKQMPGETAKRYVARLKGQAKCCDFTLPSGESDYSEKMICDQMLMGLEDFGIKEQVLAEAATKKGFMDLDKVLLFVEAKENAKTDIAHMARHDKHQEVNRLSEFRQMTDGQKLVDCRKGLPSPSEESLMEKRCRFCGIPGHGGEPDKKA